VEKKKSTSTATAVDAFPSRRHPILAPGTDGVFFIFSLAHHSYRVASHKMAP
jgi:hypothetical protein